MKLLKCYVSSFGKLKNLEYDFAEGLNTIKEDNGWGKSTLATFIKCIFYGLKDGKKSVSENERIKFKPWNSTEKFGGYIIFEWSNKQYKIERFFGNKASEDNVSLIDVASGKSFSNVENLGNRIFQIDEDGFLSTTYFSQKDFQIKSNTSITAKYNSVCEIQDSSAFDKAVENVEAKAKELKARGEKGLIFDTKRSIFLVDEEIQRAKLAEATVDELTKTLKEKEEQLKTINKESLELTDKVSQAGKSQADAVKREQFNRLNEQKIKLNKEIEELNNKLNKNNISLEDIDVQVEELDGCEKLEIYKGVLKNQLNSIEIEKSKKEKGIKPINSLALSLSSVTLVLFMSLITLTLINSLSFLSNLAGIMLILLTGILTLISVVFIIFNIEKKKIINKLNDDLIRVEKEVNDVESRQKDAVTKIECFISQFYISDTDYKKALFELKNIVNEKERLNLEVNKIEQQLKTFNFDKDFTEQKKVEDIDSLKEKLNECSRQYTFLASEIANKKSQVKFYLEKADSLSELEEKKNALTLDLERYTFKHEVLSLTSEFLKRADDRLKIKYRAPLQDSLNKYLNYITDNYKKALIDIDLDVTLEEDGSQRSTQYYSKGYQNLFEICKRFALTDVLFTKEKPFIILDDPFYNLDDEKLKKSLDLIKKLSNDYQIIYFICHESRRSV